MVEEIQVSNNSTLASISLGQDQTFGYFLDSIDWGSPTASHSTYSFPGQVGQTISNTSIKSRDVVITGYAWQYIDRTDYPELTSDEIATLRYNSILEKKGELDAIINPEHVITVKIGDFYIDGKPSKPVQFGKTDADNSNVICKFQIYLFCADPMFKKRAATDTILSESVPKFRFPLVFKPSGIIMGIRTNYQLIAFVNEGSVSIGAVFTIKALGPVTDLTIENIYTGAWMKITKTLIAGETIIIDTRKGNKSIIGNGSGSFVDYFKYWDYEGDWIEFGVGTSLIGYSTLSGDEELIDVKISSYPKFYSLEEM